MSMSFFEMLDNNFEILVVDDDPTTVQLVTFIIQKIGYSTSSANSGEQALKLINENQYDLILLDIMMPGMSGFEVIRKLMDNPSTRNKAPIIFLTAMTDTESIVKGLNLGAVDYITKPISGPIFKARVRTHLALSYQKKRLEEHTISDEITDLLNRKGFSNVFDDHLNFHKRKNLIAALLYVDLDQFKTINESIGHEAGNELLSKVSTVLKQSVREADVVGRLGGDKFVVGLLDIKSPADAAFITEKIIRAISKPYNIKSVEAFIGASIGIAFFPDDAHKAVDLIKNGENAMYHAKKKGENCYTFFEKEMETKARQKLLMDSKLRKAVQNKEFSLCYQPQVFSATGEVFGAEVLIRWIHPEEGFISPVDFIPIAEKNGLIVPIGEYVLNEACKQTKHWHDLGYKDFNISVNFSVRQFQQENLIEMIKKALDQSGLEPRFLTIEITESLLMVNIQETIDKLSELKEFGITSSIDDFGTGYSSLAYLQRFPVAHLKIDKTFVDNVVEDAAIASTIINLGRSLNLEVIAEGVEDQDQNKKLIELGCNLTQGYFFGKPMSVDEFEIYYAERSIPK